MHYMDMPINYYVTHAKAGQCNAKIKDRFVDDIE